MRHACYALITLILLVVSAVSASAATYTVTNTLDSGPGSLRDAMTHGSPTVVFDIPDTDPGHVSGCWIIKPLSALPMISTNGTILDGTTQTANHGDTNPSGPEIMLDGTLAGSWSTGLNIAGSNCVVKGLIVSGFAGNGIRIAGTSAVNNSIKGCYVGTDATGTSALPNHNGGIYILLGAFDNVIGGTAPGDRNVISGNSNYGVSIAGTHTTGNRVQGNYIGTDASGDHALANGLSGVGLDGSCSNIIGGTEPGAGNRISGNAVNGISIFGYGNNNQITGNCIGTGAASTAAIPNGNDGIRMDSGAVGNTVSDNTIAHNGRDGVNLFLYNSTVDHDRITANRIFANGGVGINLNGSKTYYGVTGRFNMSTPVANYARIHPCLTRVRVVNGVDLEVDGFVKCMPDMTYTIEFFANAAKDPSGFGEGEFYLGSTTVTTSAGMGYFRKYLLGAVDWERQYITATATDPNGNTSEFSNALVLDDAAPTLTIGANSPGNGTTTPPPGVYAYPRGSTATITATGMSGHIFEHWEGVLVGAQDPVLTLTMSAPKTITAHFVTSLAAAKLKGTTATVTATNCVVTVVRDADYFWMQTIDRSSGILVNMTGHNREPGDMVDVTGTIGTEPSGERRIRATSIDVPGAAFFEPLMLANKCVGGGPWNYNFLNGAGQKGVKLTPDKLSEESNNIGLLVRTTGKVTCVDPAGAYFYIDDGSALDDGTDQGLYVIGAVPPPSPLPPDWNPVGHHVIVTGISTCYTPVPDKNTTDVYPRIYATQVTLID